MASSTCSDSLELIDEAKVMPPSRERRRPRRSSHGVFRTGSGGAKSRLGLFATGVREGYLCAVDGVRRGREVIELARPARCGRLRGGEKEEKQSSA
jgi:hypothetical protein